MGVKKKLGKRQREIETEENGASFPWRYHGNSSAGETARCPSAVEAPRRRILTRPVRSGAN